MSDVTYLRRAIFTICSNNYVPYASVFFESARVFHPEVDIYLCLVDTLHPLVTYPGGCSIIQAADLPICAFEEFAFRYDVMEINTAVKPFMFSHLFDNLGYDQVLYFDPDIQIFSTLEQIWDPLTQGASFVLTPHLLKPGEGEDEPNDITIMRAGVFNLGFLGVSRCTEAMNILAWWSRRLRFQCFNDQPNGIFVDQKFFDLVPGFADSAVILRNLELNVAYWNLSERNFDVSRPDKPEADGKPLGFFHYSGFDPYQTDRLSKHTKYFSESSLTKAMSTFLCNYGDRLIAAGYDTIPSGLYAYSRFSSGAPIPSTIRKMFRASHTIWVGDPFETYEEWLHLPAPHTARGPGASFISNLMAWTWSQNAWLKNNFDIKEPAGAAGLVHWWLHNAGGSGFDLRFVEPVAERAGKLAPVYRIASRCPESDRVTVVGYLRTESGVGEVARLTMRALDRAGLQVEGLDVNLNVVSRREDESVAKWLSSAGTASVQVFCINADQLPAVASSVAPVLNSEAYRITIPFWELSRFPDAWLAAFDYVDEVWAPSRFIQTALSKVLAKPVIRMPVALEFPDVHPVRRTALGLSEDRFLFLYAFDFLSYAERKNPRAVLTAFRKAFGGRGGASKPMLVIKSQNGSLVEESLADLYSEISDDPDVVLLDQTLSRTDTLGLVAAADCVVSLHRSEGLGLLIAEAMAAGTPVIATDYGATTDLLSPSTGFPVDFTLTAVEEGQYPYYEGQVWAEADPVHAAWLMREVVERPEEAAHKSARAQAHLQREYSYSRVAQLQKARLQELGLVR